MAGRPPLRIGSHGKISRKHLGDGVWLARCRYRDCDGVTRIVERRGPVGDQYGCSTDMGSFLSRGQSEAAGRNRRCGPPLRCGQVRSPVGVSSVSMPTRCQV